jgi:hypothetical protein
MSAAAKCWAMSWLTVLAFSKARNSTSTGTIYAVFGTQLKHHAGGAAAVLPQPRGLEGDVIT